MILPIYSWIKNHSFLFYVKHERVYELYSSAVLVTYLIGEVYMGIIQKDLISGEYYVVLEGTPSRLRLDTYQLERYYKEGLLTSIISELKERSVEVPSVWNEWRYREGSWILSIKDREPWKDDRVTSIVIYGEPGSSPTEEEKAKAVALHEERVAKEEAISKAYWAEREKEQEALTKALKGMVGAVVVKYEAPSEDNSGYIILKTQKGDLIYMSSTYHITDEDCYESHLWTRRATPDEL